MADHTLDHPKALS
jgi:predicted ATPase